MNKLIALTAATAALTLGAAVAKPLINPQSIIVNPVDSDVEVKVWTDRDPSGSRTPDYNVGDRITVYTQTSADAYVYLFNVDPSGNVDQFLPNRYSGGANFVRANQIKAFPDRGAPFRFNVGAEGGYGVNKILAVASKTPLNLSQISEFKSRNTGFADVRSSAQGDSGQNLARALSIVVTPIPQDSWTSDTAFYNVAGGRSSAPVQPAPSAPSQGSSYGTVSIVTNQPGAEIFINNRRYGRAPTSIAELAPGSYTVTVRARGYNDYTVTITVQSNQTATVNANFQ